MAVAPMMRSNDVQPTPYLGILESGHDIGDPHVQHDTQTTEAKFGLEKQPPEEIDNQR